jgi:anti-sigma factor RsiW
MHQPVKDNLEEYLRGLSGQFAGAVPPAVEEHLGSCRGCAAELSEIEHHSMALRALRAPEGAEPRAGFYARVMQRIDDARASNSVWSAFLDPIFAKRLVFASVTLVLLAGTYMFSTEPGDQSVNRPQVSVAVSTHDAAASAEDPDNGTTPQERDAVLVSLASYQE